MKQKDNQPIKKLLVNTETAAAMLGIGLAKVKRYCSTGYEGFPAISDGGKYRIQPDLLEDWVKRMVLEGKPL